MSAATFLEWLWQSTWQASVLIALVLLVQAALGRWLTPRWRYALWLIVLVRLIMPAAPQSPVSLFNLARFIDTPANEQPPPTATATVRVAVEEFATPRPDRTISPATGPGRTVARHAQPDGALPGMLVTVWLLGVTTFAAMVLAAMIRTRRRLGGVHPTQNAALLDLLITCRRQMGIRRRVILIETDLVRGPALRGVVRPMILLPARFAESLSPDELRWVLLHELAHVKRWDAAVNWLLIVLQSVYWFNPLVWYAFHRLRGDREIACDALVLSRAGGGAAQDAQSYGQTILRILESAAEVPGPAATLAMAESMTQLTRRMRMIAGHHRPTLWQTLLGLALLLSLGCAGLTGRTSPHEPGTVVMTYDINDLIHYPPDHRWDEFPSKNKSVPDYGLDPQTVERLGDDPKALAGAARARLAQDVIKLLQETIDPDHWRARGGRIGSIREHNGVLIVSTTAKNHQEMASLLDQLREQRGIKINYESRFLLVDRNFLQEFGIEVHEFDTPGDDSVKVLGSYLDTAKADFLLGAVQSTRRAVSLAAPRITAFNGQRAVATVTKATSYVEKIEVAPGPDNKAPQPRVSAVHDGVLVEVQGTISADRRYVILDVHPRLSQLNKLEEKPAPDVPAELNAKVQVPEVDVWETQATISVPDKGTLMLMLGTGEIESEAGDPDRSKVKDERMILFLIKPTIVMQSEQESESATGQNAAPDPFPAGNPLITYPSDWPAALPR